jgi:hypothetical protein
MKKLWIILFILFFLVSTSEASWNAYLAKPGTKYRPSDTVPTDTSLTINVVRGQWGAFQVATKISGEDVAGVNVTCTTPVKGGDSLNTPLIYKQHNINVYHLSRGDGWQGETPDPLVPKVDGYYGETRSGWFPFAVNRVSPVYPVFDYNIESYASPVARTNSGFNKKLPLPTIGGTFSGGSATNYHVVIDGAGTKGVATFKWTTSAVHIKYCKRVSNVIWVYTYDAHGFSVGNTIRISTSVPDLTGTFTIPTGGIVDSTTFKLTSSGSDHYWQGGGTAIRDWNGTGVLTGDAVSLNNGLTITFPTNTYVLLDEWEFYADISRVQMIWIESYVPTTTPIGTYSSTITVSATVKSDITLTINFQVYNLTIPVTSSIPVTYGGTSTREQIADGHYGDDTTPNENLLKRYTEAMLRHRISITTYAPRITWSAGDIPDWTAYYNWVAPYVDGTWADGSAWSFFRVHTNTNNWSWVLYSTAVYESDLTTDEKNFVAKWKQYIAAAGWQTKAYWISAEEPYILDGQNPTGAQTTAIQTTYNSVRGTDTWPKSLVSKRYVSQWSGYVDTWAANWLKFSPTSYPRSVYNDEITNGKNLVSYLACDMKGCNAIVPISYYEPNYSNEIIPTDSIDHETSVLRGYYWLMSDNDIRGDLYYESAEPYFAYNVSKSGATTHDVWDTCSLYGGYGEGMFFYPGRVSDGNFAIGGTTDIPIESLRLKTIRIGLEDYEIFKIVKAAGYTTYVNTQIENAVGANKFYYDSVPTEANMETARNNIINLYFGGVIGVGITIKGGTLY